MRHRWRSLILASLSALLVALVLFASSALAAAPEEAPSIPPAPNTGYSCDGSAGVYLYVDRDYGGSCIRFTSDDPNFSDDGWNDKASSIKIIGRPGAGYVYWATLYEHNDYDGASSQFYADDPWLGDDTIGNDRASSIQVRAVPLCNLVTEIPKVECEALVDLYESSNGSSWADDTNWLESNTPCSWYGVTCGSGHVYSLDLHANNLAGSMASSVGSLSYLQALILFSNQLTGSIPESLGVLSSLQILELYSNQLSGGIPESLGSLSHLRELALYQNQLAGTIPSSLGSLPNLQSLNLSSNQLTGSIPESLGSLSNLVGLRLYSNQLTGSIPESLGSLSNLQSLRVNDNPLSGALPASLTALTLQYFYFHNTSLCELPDDAFQAWLDSIPYLHSTGILCMALEHYLYLPVVMRK